MALKNNTKQLETGLQTLYTVPTGIESSVHGLVFSNITNDLAYFDLNVYKADDNATYALADNFPVQPLKAYAWPRPLNLEVGDYITSNSTSNNTIVVAVSYYENEESISQGLDPKGIWNSGITYQKNDLVYYDGTSYGAITTSTNQQPGVNTAAWVIFSEKGFTGSQGNAGFTGSVGFTGSQGTTGFTGSLGFTGSRGLIGFTGSRGDTGFTGSQGSTGFTGSVGFTGSIGFTGSQGTTGFTGSVGRAAPRAITVEDPSNTEKIPLFFTDTSYTISRIQSVITATGTSPTITFSIRYGSDLSASGTEVVTSGITTTSTTTGTSTTSFNNATVAANNFVWITTSVSTNVASLHVSVL